MSTHQELRERFEKQFEWSPVMGTIANWWLNEISQRDKELVEALEGMKQEYGERIYGPETIPLEEVEKYGFNLALEKVATLINSRSKEANTNEV